MYTFNPKILSSLKHYNLSTFVSDLISGIIVAIIAMPLSIALAVASGANPQQGLYTSLIAGCITSLLGGSKVNITGPTAAFAGIIFGILTNEELGYNVLVYATILAGIILILLGIFKLGNLINLIPYVVTIGFTAGVAVTLLIGQFKDFTLLGYTDLSFKLEYTHQKLYGFILSIKNFSLTSLILGLISLAILIAFPMLSKSKNKVFVLISKIPASLIAVIITSLLVCFVPFFNEVKTIGQLYTIDSGLPKFVIPLFDASILLKSIPYAFEIALLAGIESLLSCVVSDDMIKDKHNPNTELIALGLGNTFSVLFGGIPATGAIARTTANVNNGGKTPVAGVIHALMIGLVLLFLMPLAKVIPMPCIASILFVVAYNMSGLKKIKDIIKSKDLGKIIVLFATMLVTIILNLIYGIAIGLLLNIIFYLINKKKTQKALEN